MANPYSSLIKMIQQTEKAKTLGEQFVTDLNRYFQLSKENYTPSKSIKPSSLGGCMRQQYFILDGATADLGAIEKAENITIQQSGNDRHNRIQNACQDAVNFHVPIVWLDPEAELQITQQKGINTFIKRRDGNELLCINTDYRASFKCDGIIHYEGKKMILEIKTEEYNKFNARFAPEPNHEFQAVMYSLCFGIEDIMFLYEDRNLTLKKGYHVKVDPNLKDRIQDKIRLIILYYDTNTLPPKEKEKCTYCRYKQECKKNSDTDSFSAEELNLLYEKQQASKQGERGQEV